MARPAREIPWTSQEHNGTYYVNWYDRKARRTRRKSLETKSADTAQDRYAEFLSNGREIYNGRRVADAGMTGDAAIDYYEAEHVNRHVIDKERVTYAFKNIRAAFGDADLKDLAEEDFEEYLEKRQSGDIGRVAGEATVRREISAFRAAVNHNVRRRRLSLQETPIWWLPEDTPVKCDKWLRMEQIDKLLGAATSKRVERFIQLGYWTAGRKNTIELLKPDRVFLDTEKIDLHPPWRKRTKKRNAVVPIMPELMDYIAPVVALMPEDEFIVGGNVRSAFTATVKAAGLSDLGVTPHWLRHSRATHLLQDGKKLWSVAGLLGDTVTTVERVYGHHCPHQLKEELA